MGTIATTDSRAEVIIESARALRPLIESLRDEMETERRMPRALVDAMLDAGLFHLLVPRAAGGAETDPITYMRVVEEVACVDGSAGWNLMIGSGSGIVAGFIPEDVARQAYGPTDVVAGVLAPTGKAVAVDGGFRVTGRWSFASGINHATWAFGNCIVFDGETPRTSDGAPVFRMMLAPASDYEIHDTWHVSGLRGTGSNDYSLADVFVPDEHGFMPFAGEIHQSAPLYKLPFTFFPASIAPVLLGIARGAIDVFVELATTKVPARFGPRIPLRERPRAQIAVAQAEAMLGSARTYLYDAMEKVWETVQAGDEANMRQRATLRGAACHAAIASAQVVDLMYNTGGGSSIYYSSLLQRAFRDVHAATQHVGVAPDSMEEVGRVLLGLSPTAPIL